MEPILQIAHLSHRYATGWAIRDLNLEINHHGIVGLVGSNGAGKSTTMNIVCGVLHPTQGTVLVNGADLRLHPDKAKNCIGFLPQQPPLYTDLTVKEFLIYCAQLRFIHAKEIQSRVSEVMQRCSLAQVSSRLIRNLSGGYRQRVGIAQAIIHRPRLVVMDEPTNGLDPNQMIELRKLITEISQECAVLWSSHILTEVQMLCRDLIMIDGGKVVFADSMEAFNNHAKTNSVLMRMETPPQMQELLKIDRITNVTPVSGGQLRLFFEGQNDITQQLIILSVQNGWGLQEISLEKALPDDTFKKLSTGSI